jgi:hypothetical protein
VSGRRGRPRGWTHYVSVGCFVILLAASSGFLFVTTGFGLWVSGPAIGALIIAGTRNTWEILIRARKDHHQTEDEPTRRSGE